MSRRYNRHQNNDPKEMNARFDSLCKECGKIIHKNLRGPALHEELEKLLNP